ncbi:MAG: hypothetical protein P8X57_02730 [Cyclobacteriaceae bacterium]
MTLITGFLFFIIPAAIYGLWINAVNKVEQHEQRVELFRSYFPEFLQGRFHITYLSIIFLVVAVWMFAIVIGKSEGNLKYTAIILQVLSGLLLFLNVFSLM